MKYAQYIGYDLLHIPVPPRGVLQRVRFRNRLSARKKWPHRLSTRATWWRPNPDGSYYVRRAWGWRCIERVATEGLTMETFCKALRAAQTR